MPELKQSPLSRSPDSHRDRGKWRPYLLISLAGLLAFAPVSFMLQALKNDIIVLEYPINYFISEAVRNGEIPYWFNTWGMGFPLQSNLTWGIFSTPQLFFSGVFSYNVWILHIEFMFFVLLSGWSMFYLLRKFVVKDDALAQVLAIAYMLSGFVVGSSQWLLYITAASFVPLVIASLLSLVQRPSIFHAVRFAVMYLLMFTSVYAAFNIITTYALVVFVIIYLLRNRKESPPRAMVLKYLLLGGSFAAILCMPVLYFTSEVLQHISRGDAIETQTSFFNSNYLHPSALSSLLLPFSSVRMHFANTEGTMLDTYMGLFTILILPATIAQNLKEKNRTSWLLLAAALLFLLASFGQITPVRGVLNLLPGFSYFRNPAIFRFYFILTLIVYIAFVLRNYSWGSLLETNGPLNNRITRYTLFILLLTCIIVVALCAGNMRGLQRSAITALIKNMNSGQALFISAGLQIFFLLLLLLVISKRKTMLAKWIFTFDLIVNLVICTPYFTVSSYSLAEADRILHSEKGFPVQSERINEVAATYTDDKMNTWHNVNVYRKKVSSLPSYRGPLLLKNTTDSLLNTLTDHSLVFASNPAAVISLIVTIQRPTHIQVSIDMLEPATIKALQNHYPGWKVYYNDKKQALTNINQPGLSVDVPAGKGIIDFRYRRNGALLSAIVLHAFTTGFLFYAVWRNFSQRRRGKLRHTVI
jgi:hypothetical protein